MKKRICLAVEIKKKILKEVDEKILSKTQIAQKYGIPKNSLSTILKAREKIFGAKNGNDECGPSSRKYFRESKHPNLERALLVWFRKMRSLNIPIDGNVLKEQAHFFASKLNIKDFKASDGWLQKFKFRNGLSFRKVCGESAAVDTSSANEWKEEKLKLLLSEYAADDVFNADETALFFKILPERTLAYKGDKCVGGNKAKERLTVLIAANMTGSQKLPLLFIGKYLKPRCFKNVQKIPAAYYANNKAWMTGNIYEKWLRDLDNRFSAEKRKVLLIVDNCTAHMEVTGLQAIRVEYLPPNATAVLQPMDQGIINSFKRKYKKVLLQRVILGLEREQPYQIDILGAMHLSISAWNDVLDETISKAFRHAGFIKETDVTEEIHDNRSHDEDEVLMHELRRRNPQLPELSFENFLNVDSNVICTEEISDHDIISSIINENERLSDSEEEDENEVTPRPTLKQAAEYLSELRRFFEASDNCEMLTNIEKMESCI
ncbi:Tigger transposable element-derived protein 6, partial [Stegodyphus mimosarum]